MKLIKDNKWKIIIFILFIIIGQISLCQNIDIFADEEGKIYKFAGDQNHPPYEYINKKGEFIGFNIDIIEVIARDQNINIEIM